MALGRFHRHGHEETHHFNGHYVFPTIVETRKNSHERLNLDFRSHGLFCEMAINILKSKFDPIFETDERR